jgi:hypothetical protein
MNIITTHKLDGIPKIYYLNLDEREDRKTHMETQFKNWNINNYERVSTSRFLQSKKSEWEHLLLDTELIQTYSDLSANLNHIKTIIDWYDNDTSEYCIIMEDDVNIDIAKYWTFDWNILMENLPYNWDCIQLYTSRFDKISMHLKPRMPDSYSSSCYMITRHFAKKLKSLHYFDGKYKLHINTKDISIPEYEYGTSDFFLYGLGVTYTLPIFNLNKKLKSSATSVNIWSDTIEELCSEAIEYWWFNHSSNNTIFDLFNYNKNYDEKMDIYLNLNTSTFKVITDSMSTGFILWI